MGRLGKERAAWIVRLVAILVVLAPVAVEAQVSHRAIYGFTDPTGGLRALEGGLAISNLHGCGETVQTSEMAITVDGPAIGAIRLAERTETRERLDGSAYQSIRTVERNGDRSSEQMVAVRRPDGSYDLTVRNANGERRERLPSETLFPARFERTLIEAARRGQGRLDAAVFVAAATTTMAARSRIGAPRDAATYTGHEGTPLDPGAVWPVRTAYFPLTGQAGQPVAQFELEIHGSGVAPAVFLELGPVRLQARLRRLDRLADPRC